MHDLLIRGATVVDGLGHDPIRADVAVEKGRIAAIGDIATEARETVDAGGLALMPGIMLFDPATVGVSAARRVNDLPGGGPRTIRDPIGVNGVFVNGVRVFDGTDYVRLGKGPGQALDRFLPARAAS